MTWASVCSTKRFISTKRIADTTTTRHVSDELPFPTALLYFL